MVSFKRFVVAETVIKFPYGEEEPKMQVKNNMIVVYSRNIALLLTLWEIQDTLQFVEIDQIDR